MSYPTQSESLRLREILHDVAEVLFFASAGGFLMYWICRDASIVQPMHGSLLIATMASVLAAQAMIWATENKMEAEERERNHRLHLKLCRLLIWSAALGLGIVGPVLNVRSGATPIQAAFVAAWRLFPIIPLGVAFEFSVRKWNQSKKNRY